MTEITLPFVKLSEKAKIPSQATSADAGYDLFSTEAYILKPEERKLFKTNISAAIPHGYYGRIAPRS
jgi:dUTP pyrophosphatase